MKGTGIDFIQRLKGSPPGDPVVTGARVSTCDSLDHARMSTTVGTWGLLHRETVIAGAMHR
ncbi:MAG: hypothetical protein M1812_005789, partial [Candelaria pacifica]